MSDEKKDPNGFHLRLTPSQKVVVQAIAKLQGTDASTVLTRMILPHLDEHIVLAQELFEQGIIGNSRD